jgi:hypothetical protein
MNALASGTGAMAFKLSNHQVPEDLVLTNRILIRWAASVGDCTEDSATWQEIIRAKVPPLPDDIAIVVDQLVLRAPRGHRKLVELWYRKPDPREVIAEKLRISEAKVYLCWRVALQHFRVHFESSPLGALKRLAGIDTESRLKFVRGVLMGMKGSS